MMKLILALLWTVLCIAIGLLPELGMYLTWGAIHPEGEIAKILLLAFFWLAGGGLCVFVGIMAAMLWAAVITVILA